MAVGNLDLNLLKSAVTDVLDTSGKAATDTANATAQGIVAQGNTTEAGLYGNAIDVAQQNAQFAQIAGDIQDVQEQRQAAKATGKLQAGVAANGFGNGGTSLALAEESLRQGYLAQQLNQVQTQENKGGFLEQATAAMSEQQAAQTAAQSATALGTAYTQASQVATANAANETAALEQYLAVVQPPGTTLTPEQAATQAVVTSALKAPQSPGAATLPQPAVPSATNVTPEGAPAPGSLGSFLGYNPTPALGGATGSTGTNFRTV